MEIKVIPARLQKHTVYLEEEIRIARRIEEMAEEVFGADPGGAEILASVRKLCRSIELRREILETLYSSLRDQAVVLQEYVKGLWRQNF